MKFFESKTNKLDVWMGKKFFSIGLIIFSSYLFKGVIKVIRRIKIIKIYFIELGTFNIMSNVPAYPCLSLTKFSNRCFPASLLTKLSVDGPEKIPSCSFVIGIGP
jgi:hypothetical protein